ncbi:MAG: ATP-binding cassette domain-containing protein [Bacteroidota bacterium]
MTILQINNLNKRYKKVHALNNLDLTINKGQVFGLLGPNGSGKTTTLGIILDVIQASSGSYSWFGKDQSANSRNKVGSILETPCFYPYLTATQNLKVAAEIKKSGKDRIDEVLKIVGLYERRNDSFKTYSLGMKQRLSIASALLNDPPVLILDEPTNGLDPQGIAEIRQLIKEIADQNKTIILASHLLDEVQKVCSHFAVLRKGVKLHEGSVHEVLSETDEVEISSDDESLEKSIQDFNGTKNYVQTDGLFRLQLDSSISNKDLNEYFFNHGITLTHLVRNRNSLEKEFLEILAQND